MMMTSLSLAPAHGQSQSDLAYKLSDRQLRCLRSNAKVYRNAKRDPILIPLNDCPRLPDNPILGALVAEGPTTVNVSRDTNAGDTLIYVTKSQLECLVAAMPRKGAKLFKFYPNTCQLKPIP